MARYVTTNLRFTEGSYRELRYQAHRRGTTLATLVREAVDRYLGRSADGPSLAFGDDPADGIVGSVTGSPGDESVNHDHYLYGWSRTRPHAALR